MKQLNIKNASKFQYEITEVTKHMNFLIKNGLIAQSQGYNAMCNTCKVYELELKCNV
jgi:hypothetical protein